MKRFFQKASRDCGTILLPGILSLLLVFLLNDASATEDTLPLSVAGVSRQEALRLGERMYREGILPSGEPMLAVVQGDIPVDSRIFACVSCHQRSGMGSFEGTVFSPPVNGARLYKPWSKISDLSDSARKKLPRWMQTANFRPAYTDETLAVALRAGENPTGRKFKGVMPRYFLNDSDTEIMVFYLKNLSAESAPGVTATTMRLATVIAGDVSPEDREAMLAPLQFFVTTWGRSRSMELRARKTDDPMYTGYRKLILSVWELKGPPESWLRQLEEYYKKDPVFALLGGIAAGDWAPIHKFSEEHKIPTIFPVTDFPVTSETDWYTLYFSKGFHQEGEATAKYLRRAEISEGTSIVQVFRNNRAGLALSKGFQDTWRGFGQRPPENMMLDQESAVTENFLKELTVNRKNTVLLLWLDDKDLPAIGNLTQGQNGPRMVFVSSSLMGQGLYSLPEKVRSFVYITYPYRLPQEDKGFRAIVEAWLRNNKIPASNLTIESQMYDLVAVLSEPLSMLKSDFYRDYLLEQIDMMEDQSANIALYPHLSFGPGQRYASKGCYIVQLTEGARAKLVKRSEWVIH